MQTKWLCGFLRHGDGNKVSLHLINKNILIREMLFSTSEIQYTIFSRYEKNWNEPNYYFFILHPVCSYTSNPALITCNAQARTDVPTGSDEPWWGLPRHVLWPSSSPRHKAAAKRGDMMTWPGPGWESIPGCSPMSSTSGGQLVLNLPCPVAFCHGGSRELNFSFCFRFFLFLIHIKFLAGD